jgi:hypothetical protein
MLGMFTSGFSGESTGEFAVSHSFHHEFAPSAIICELNLTSASESADTAGADLGFLSFTFVDPDLTPHDVAIDFGSRTAHVGHNGMTRVDWYMRIYNINAAGLFNAFFWPSVF